MPAELKKIGIVGAGQMGNGIAHVCALAGYDVYLADVGQEQLDKAMAVIEKNMARQVGKGTISESEKDTALKRIETGIAYDGFKTCDLVIEAATEDEQVKKDILKKLCPVLGPDTIIASNTSSISITRLAAGTDRPGKFVGMHFMNPVPVMELVELIRGITTDAETYEVIRELVKKLGKKPVNAEDFPAFIVNRLLLPMINEAVYTLYEASARCWPSTPPCGSGPATPWGRWSWPISSDSTSALPS